MLNMPNYNQAEQFQTNFEPVQIIYLTCLLVARSFFFFFFFFLKNNIYFILVWPEDGRYWDKLDLEPELHLRLLQQSKGSH